MIKIQQVETFVYRYPLKTPVQTSFGTMNDRPMVIVKLTDQDNVVGFGEIWCNYPACGAEHRANLVKSVLTDLIYSHTFNKPSEVFELLTTEHLGTVLTNGRIWTYLPMYCWYRHCDARSLCSTKFHTFMEISWGEEVKFTLMQVALARQMQ